MRTASGSLARKLTAYGSDDRVGRQPVAVVQGRQGTGGEDSSGRATGTTRVPTPAKATVAATASDRPPTTEWFSSVRTSRSPRTAFAAGANQAVCDKLQQEALGLAKGGPATTPAALAKRLRQLAQEWTRASAQSKDRTLRTSVQKAAGVLTALADSAVDGKKVSLAQLQAQLKSAAVGLKKACAQSTSA